MAATPLLLTFLSVLERHVARRWRVFEASRHGASVASRDGETHQALDAVVVNLGVRNDLVVGPVRVVESRSCRDRLESRKSTRLPSLRLGKKDDRLPIQLEPAPALLLLSVEGFVPLSLLTVIVLVALFVFLALLATASRLVLALPFEPSVLDANVIETLPLESLLLLLSCESLLLESLLLERLLLERLLLELLSIHLLLLLLSEHLLLLLLSIHLLSLLLSVVVVVSEGSMGEEHGERGDGSVEEHGVPPMQDGHLPKRLSLLCRLDGFPNRETTARRLFETTRHGVGRPARGAILRRTRR